MLMFNSLNWIFDAYSTSRWNRFSVLAPLVKKCPYGNVSAALVDQIRSDVVRAWVGPSDLTGQSGKFRAYVHVDIFILADSLAR